MSCHIICCAVEVVCPFLKCLVLTWQLEPSRCDLYFLWSQCVSCHISCWIVLGGGCSSALPHLPLSLEPIWQVDSASWQLLPSEAHTCPVAMFLQLLFHLIIFLPFCACSAHGNYCPLQMLKLWGNHLSFHFLFIEDIKWIFTLCISFRIRRLCFHFTLTCVLFLP